MRTPGSGSFLYDHVRSDGPVRIETFWHRPASWREDGPLLVVMHGYKRNGAQYRDDWVPLADRYGFTVVVPEFSKAWFPTPREYEVGNMRNADRTAYLPPSDWNYEAIEGVFDMARHLSGAQRERYLLYGHSAGGQFVHRMVMFKPDARIETAVAANAGAYTVPRPEARFPYGTAGAPLDETMLKAGLAQNMVLLLGEKDVATEGGVLLKSPEALRQGPHRFARGQYYFEAGRETAAALDTAFGWRVVSVPGVGHSNAGMSRAAADLLFGNGSLG